MSSCSRSFGTTGSECKCQYIETAEQHAGGYLPLRCASRQNPQRGRSRDACASRERAGLTSSTRLSRRASRVENNLLDRTPGRNARKRASVPSAVSPARWQ